MRIVDDEGRELPAGEPGEICARSPGVMDGYWRAPEVTAEALRDGWLHTGDVGYLDEDGYLFIVDRKKDLIIRGGFNVYPRDVEDGLLEHPAVEMAGVVGKPDAIHGEEVVAFVSLRNGQESTRGGAGRLGAIADRRLQVPARGADRRLDPADAGGQDRPQGAAVSVKPATPATDTAPRRPRPHSEKESERPTSVARTTLSHVGNSRHSREAYQIPSSAA